jgi:hypothetical protein
MDEAGTEGIEDVAAELLALPPERFTEARNAAAKALRAEGRKDAADAVKRLPRPPLALWLLNRLAREQAPLVEAFLAAAADLRVAYRTGGDIRAATAPEREAEARVAAAAAQLARGEGTRISDTVTGSIAQTLRAAAADEGIAAQLQAGLLVREPAPPSIGDLLGSIPPAPSGGDPDRPAAKRGRRAAATHGEEADARDGDEAAAKQAESARRDERRRDLREQIAAAKADASTVRSEARAAIGEAARLHAEWEQAESAAERAVKRRDAAGELLADLQEQLDEL